MPKEKVASGARRGAGNEPKRKRAREEAAERPPPAIPNLNRPMTPKTVDEAVKLQSHAAVKRAVGRSMIEDYGDHIGGRFEIAKAADMEAAAEVFLDPGTHVTGPQAIGNGGEMVVATNEAWGSVPGVIDTLRENPDMLNAEASRNRLELTANSLTLAVDAAESIKARNSIEKMLAHQMAAAHRLAMKFLDKGTFLLSRFELGVSGLHPLRETQFASVEAARLANAATRLMASYQDALLALDRTRRGGRQTVRVVHQHVAVGPGGQAVVAGNMKAGGRGQKSEGSSSEMTQQPHAKRRGWLKNGNPPGDLRKAKRCGARTRIGQPCRGPAMANGRCRMHGGPSTGPRTTEGKERSRKASWRHGRYSAEAI